MICSLYTDDQITYRQKLSHHTTNAVFLPSPQKAISDRRDEFQQLVLEVVQRAVISEFKALQTKEFTSSRLCSVLHVMVTSLSKDLSWLQAPTTMQQFYWGIIASCCETIHISKTQFEWVHLYESAITCLGHIYTSYCKEKELPEDKCLLSADGSPRLIAHSKHIEKYVLAQYTAQARHSCACV